MITNRLHQGYVDALFGRKPDQASLSYENGYLHGLYDRDAELAKDPNWVPPQYLTLDNTPPFKKGDKVVVPKGTPVRRIGKGTVSAGRTHSVTLHDVYPMVEAYTCYDGEFKRPRPPQAVWAGAGGYWADADITSLRSA